MAQDPVTWLYLKLRTAFRTIGSAVSCRAGHDWHDFNDDIARMQGRPMAWTGNTCWRCGYTVTSDCPPHYRD